MAEQVKSLGVKVSVQATLIRLLRLLVGQLPTLIAWLTSHPASSKLVMVGLALNAIFKFLRDMYPGWIIWVPL
jgi:hypothetical protein